MAEVNYCWGSERPSARRVRLARQIEATKALKAAAELEWDDDPHEVGVSVAAEEAEETDDAEKSPESDGDELNACAPHASPARQRQQQQQQQSQLHKRTRAAAQALDAAALPRPSDVHAD